MFEYQVLIGNRVEKTFPEHLEGLAVMAYESTALAYDATLLKTYIGNDYDPIIHVTQMYNINLGCWENAASSLR